MEQNDSQVTLSISDLWSIFTGHIVQIIAAAVLIFLAAFGYSLLTYKPQYKSTAMIYILRQSSEGTTSTVSNADFSLALSTVNDCTIILTSHSVIDKVISELGMPITYNQLKSMISISNPTSSRVLQISITAPSPMDAKIIVDELCKVGAVSIQDTLGINQVNLVDKGTYSETPSNSMITPVVVVAPVLAAVAVFGIYVLVFVLDDKIKTPDDVEKYLGLTVLGLIPNIGGDENNRYGKYRYGKYGSKYGASRTNN